MKTAPPSRLSEIRALTERMEREGQDEAVKHYLWLACGLVGVGLWRWKVSNGYIFWDNKMCDLWGCCATPEDCDNHVDLDRFLNSLHPDDQSRIRAELRACTDHGTPYDVHYRIRRLDNQEERLIHARGQMTDDRQWMIGVCMDITEVPGGCCGTVEGCLRTKLGSTSGGGETETT